MDIGDEKQIATVDADLKDRPLDLLINNAGIADGYGHSVYELKDDPDIQNYDFASERK